MKASERLEARAKDRQYQSDHEEALAMNKQVDQDTIDSVYEEAQELNREHDKQKAAEAEPLAYAMHEIREENLRRARERKQRRHDARVRRLTAAPRGVVRLAGRAYRSRASRTLRATGRAVRDTVRDEWNK